MGFRDLSSARPPICCPSGPMAQFPLRHAVSEGFPAALLIFLFVSLSAPALLSVLCSLDSPDSPRVLSHAAFVSQLSQISDREAG